MTNNNLTVLTNEIIEKTTAKISAAIQDEDGIGIAAASLTTLTLTLYNMDDSPDYTILNARDAQDILNTNNVTVDAGGNLVWSVQPGDTTILGGGDKENHRAVFEWTYDTGAKNGKHIIDMTIVNVKKTT